jgi:hypothetical protein
MKKGESFEKVKNLFEKHEMAVNKGENGYKIFKMRRDLPKN